MAWTTRMCIVAVSPVVQRRNTWSWDSDWKETKQSVKQRFYHQTPLFHMSPRMLSDRYQTFSVQSILPAKCAHPAVKILSLFGLPHPLDVWGEDVEESTEHGFRLRPARMSGEQVVHDGGAFDDKPRNVLRRAIEDEIYAGTAPFWTKLIQEKQYSVITRARSLWEACSSTGACWDR